MLSTEQGVYIAESVATKNTKQPKGRFKLYDDNDGPVSARSIFLKSRIEYLPYLLLLWQSLLLHTGPSEF